MALLDRILRAGEGKKVKALADIVPDINAQEPEIHALSDQALKGKTAEFRSRIERGEDTDDLLVEAFAVVREASLRVIGERHYDVQLQGGLALHHGNIAEMATGEGKTLSSTCPVYLNALGGKKFGRVTGENIGRPFAIVLDGKVVSAPVIQSQIFTNGQMTGNLSVEETQELSLILRAGALPAPLIVLEERSVGPGLGADSIAAGKIAAIVGMVLVIVYMFVSYGLFGLFADIALCVNIILILAALSALQATLTLPGIAGIVLTMGMAVDANVLIFERIREEVKAGRSVRAAIEAGYDRAISTIIDSNLTTLFAALFLFIFGSGPIKGFAVTLSLGIITSMFTAILVTRLIITLYVNRTRPKLLSL